MQKQYDIIEELMLELSLYPNKKLDILEDCAKKCEYGWFAVAKDGNCALFDSNGELDDISKVKSISRYMIPKDIEKINIPDSVTSIGNLAFAYCNGLTSVTIPDSVMSIEYDAFQNCSGLMSVTIPDSMTSIGAWAFSWCSRLTSVTIGTSVTYIGSGAFCDCSSLTSVMIPDSVTSIGNNAFDGCKLLTSVTIGNSVTSIGNRAFYRCNKLKKLVFKDKTLEEVKLITYYPFGIEDESIIKCEE